MKRLNINGPREVETMEQDQKRRDYIVFTSISPNLTASTACVSTKTTPRVARAD